MSQSQIKHEFVIIQLGSLRGAVDANLTGAGAKSFLERYAGSADSSLVRVSLTNGSLQMEREDRAEQVPEAPKEMVN